MPYGPGCDEIRMFVMFIWQLHVGFPASLPAMLGEACFLGSRMLVTHFRVVRQRELSIVARNGSP